MNALPGEIHRQGAYPLDVAARLAHMQLRTARRWVRGYRYRRNGEAVVSGPITFLAQPSSDEVVLDFEQLLTLLLVKAFTERGLGLPTIKKAAARAQLVYGGDNPFVNQRFRSDGNRVFIDLEPGVGKERQLIDVLSDQHQFRAIVEPSLFRDVVFVGDRASEWWPLGTGRSVVVAPGRQFGAPHIAGKGVRTDVIAQMVNAEGGGAAARAAAADWFGLTADEVADAVDFEGPWASEAKA